MKIYISRHILAVCMAMFIVAAPAQAVVIYNETTSIDIANSTNVATDFGTLTATDNLVIGSLDGGSVSVPGTDEHDVFTFTATSDWMLDFDELLGQSMVVFMYDASATFMGATTVNGAATDVFSTTFGTGTFFLNFTPQSNMGANSYVANIRLAAVPEPAGIALLAFGLIGMSFMRKKRSL